MTQHNKEEIFIQFTKNAGLTPKLVASTPDKIPDNIMPCIPQSTIINMYEPRIYPTGIGYGLTGSSRIGKSCANSVVIKRGMRGLINACVEHISDSTSPAHEYERCQVTLEKCTSYEAHRIVNWVYWPECYDWFQKNTITDFGSGRLPRFHTESLKNTKLLILDDLGRETLSTKSSEYGMPYALGQLALIINHRNEHNLPIIWTSNLEEVDLIAIYGAPLYLRLVEIAPCSRWLSSTHY